MGKHKIQNHSHLRNYWPRVTKVVGQLVCNLVNIVSMQLLQLSSGKSMLLHIWVVRLCAFHNLVMTHSICFLKLYTICNKSFYFLFSISFHKYLQKLSLCIFPPACIQYPWIMRYVFTAICLASLLVSHTKKKNFPT